MVRLLSSRTFITALQNYLKLCLNMPTQNINGMVEMQKPGQDKVKENSRHGFDQIVQTKILGEKLLAIS